LPVSLAGGGKRRAGELELPARLEGERLGGAGEGDDRSAGCVAERLVAVRGEEVEQRADSPGTFVGHRGRRGVGRVEGLLVLQPHPVVGAGALCGPEHLDQRVDGSDDLVFGGGAVERHRWARLYNRLTDE